MKRTFSSNQGFTIVELVVVIILLGILAATALPRFIDVDDDAHAAAFEGVMGGLQTGVALFHAQWIADGTPAPGQQILQFANLRTNDEGYPYSLTAGTNVVASAQDCEDVFVGVLQSAPTIDSGAIASAVNNGNDFFATQSGETCTFHYIAQNNTTGTAVPVMVYDSTTGTVTQGANVTLP